MANEMRCESSSVESNDAFAEGFRFVDGWGRRVGKGAVARPLLPELAGSSDAGKNLVVHREVDVAVEAPAGHVVGHQLLDVAKEGVLRLPPQKALRLVDRGEEVRRPAAAAARESHAGGAGGRERQRLRQAAAETCRSSSRPRQAPTLTLASPLGRRLATAPHLKGKPSPLASSTEEGS